jgi:CBS domain-containing protein
MKVKDVMTSPAICVSPKTKLKDVIGLVIQHRISSVPVVDHRMRLLGIVSQADLFLKEKTVPFSLVKALTLFNEWATPKELERPHPELDRYTASDVMTRVVHYADADAELTDVALMMVRNGVKRVPVVSDGRLVGMITRHDLVSRMGSSRLTDPTAA